MENKNDNYVAFVKNRNYIKLSENPFLKKESKKYYSKFLKSLLFITFIIIIYMERMSQ